MNKNLNLETLINFVLFISSIGLMLFGIISLIIMSIIPSQVSFPIHPLFFLFFGITFFYITKLNANFIFTLDYFLKVVDELAKANNNSPQPSNIEVVKITEENIGDYKKRFPGIETIFGEIVQKIGRAHV